MTHPDRRQYAVADLSSLATWSRRHWLRQAGAGFGNLAWLTLLAESTTRTPSSRAGEGVAETGTATGVARPTDASLARDRLLPTRPPSRVARAVIFLYMDGGPSHIDLLDPKPKLRELAGQPLPASFGPIQPAMGETHAPILPSARHFKRFGMSGIEVSDWLPHLAAGIDDWCVIRSCWADGRHHGPAMCQMNTGATLPSRPSLGAWTYYGLGLEKADLPAFVVLSDQDLPTGGQSNWSAGFLPAHYQGVHFLPGAVPIPYLAPAQASANHSRDAISQRSVLDLTQALNQHYGQMHPTDAYLQTRLAAMEQAYRMQTAATAAIDLTQESKAIHRLYGLDSRTTAKVARNCLLARRLVERGVRFVQVYCGSGCLWDSHENIEEQHRDRCREMDQPVAALLTDLKRTGLLAETLVIWGGEFGRTPISEKKTGRDHNPHGFTMLLAGAGIKAGQVIGQTDEVGLHAIEDRLHVNDLHATILHALGIDHLKLTFPHHGRDERATVNGGQVLHKVFA